ncbi:histidine kinase [Streptomyces sp. Agncl-13]|uniref:sensor histidine kinase n=1 Tax=Streptomyces sp. Agncl-13 TaxID=3400628 RepID=UPI003A83B02C
METTTRHWALPLLLVAVQLAELGPAAAYLDVRTPGPVGAAGLLIAVTAETVALSRRQRMPVRALLWTLGASALGQTTAYDAYADLALPVALYSVAVRCPAAVTLRALAATVGVSWFPAAVRFGFHPALATQLAIVAGTYVVCAGLGLARRQWLARRLAAARLLAGAEESRQRAGEDERARLARELHDVSAHHLTSVVVTVDVARRLGDRRPELVAEALEFAERTGRETLTAIHRLVAMMRDTRHAEARPMTDRIHELIAGFSRLGRPIATELPDDLAGPAAEAVHGIVREALTNALRHAPGAAVRVGVQRVGGTLELTVDNTAARGPADYTGMGSGRGVTGMRERAAAVGGELTAGPGPGFGSGSGSRSGFGFGSGPGVGSGSGSGSGTSSGSDFASASGSDSGPGPGPCPGLVSGSGSGFGSGPHSGSGPGSGPSSEGGWRVRAQLPDVMGPLRSVARPRRRDHPREQRLTDSALTFTATVLPLVVLLTAAEDWAEGPAGAGAVALVSALLALHALPLLWRRRAPWLVLTAVLVASWLWPPVCAFAPLSGQVSPYLAGGLLAETLAVYTLGAYGRGATRTWPAPLVTAGASAGALTVTAAADGELAGGPASALTGALIAVPLGMLLCLLFALAWGAGLIVRARRLRAVARDDFALGNSLWEARTAAGAERNRLAARLREAVLHRTSTLVQLAHQGRLESHAVRLESHGVRLEEVAAEARATLAAMRELLHEMSDADGAAEAPADAQGSEHSRLTQPTAADLAALCRTAGPAGRKVTVRGVPKSTAGLPEPVVLTTYRLLETALGAGDRGPIRIRLRRRRHRSALHLTITGVRLAVNGPVTDRLRAQATAAEARIAFEQPGTVRVLLPLLAGPSQAPVPAEEVSPSPHV